MKRIGILLSYIIFSVVTLLGQNANTLPESKKAEADEISLGVSGKKDSIKQKPSLLSPRRGEEEIPISPTQIINLEIPKAIQGEQIITHTAYTLSYNEKHEQVNWVAYELTRKETEGIFERTNKFIPDPMVTTGTADKMDYEGSGYDRGHLAPAADMAWSATAMKESFYYSNMSPQVPQFNRGIWKKLEEQVRTWAEENNAVYVVTGPVLKEGLPAIGTNNVSVPRYFYKVILDYSEPGIKGIGFIMPNSGSRSALQNFAVTIDSVENFSGIDFFPQLPDEQENIIESTVNVNSWSWKESYFPKDKLTRVKAVQCHGITKAGERCKNITANPGGYCHLHESQTNEYKPGEIIPNDKFR